jgi:menaquinone-dependent protoporphyrinogen oxidase
MPFNNDRRWVMRRDGSGAAETGPSLEITRRGLLKSGLLITAGIGMVGVSGFASKTAWAGKGEPLQRETGASRGGKKVLVCYATMHGSTTAVAEAVGDDLRKGGVVVDVRSVESVTDVGLYEAVVVGSAIRTEKWLPQATVFVKNNKEILKDIPTAYFLTCLTLVNPSEEARTKAQTFLRPLLETVPEVKPTSIGLFAGVLDYSKYSAPVKAVMKYKMWSQSIKEGDYRDWGAIHAWAGRFASVIPGGRAVTGA